MHHSSPEQTSSSRGRFSGRSNPEGEQIDSIGLFSGSPRSLRELAMTNYND